MNNNLLVLGAGGYGTVVNEIALEMNCFNRVAFIDDSFIAEKNYYNLDLIGRLNDCKMLTDSFDFAIVAIGNYNVRKKWINILKESGYRIPVIISPKAYVSSSAHCYEGVVIEPNASVMPNSRIGCGSYISAGAVVNHNSTVSGFCHIDCNSVIMTGSTVPEGTLVRSGEVYFNSL